MYGAGRKIMTARERDKKECKERTATSLLPVILLLTVIGFALFLSGRVAEGAISGMRFAVFTILPSAYPFMILGDLYASLGAPERIRPLAYLTTRALGIEEGGLRAFICGTVAGFPLGAKMAAELYTGGVISRKEAEKLAAISNNPSIPFVTAAVGEAVYGDVKIGIILLIVIYISTIITANLFRTRPAFGASSFTPSRAPFNLTASVKNAAFASVNIIAFVSLFFSVISGISLFIKGDLPLSFISSFLEVTTAVSLSSSLALPLFLKLSITAFALGFGGLSVMMQSSVFTKAAGLSLKRYFAIKLTEGSLAAVLTAAVFLILPYFQ